VTWPWIVLVIIIGVPVGIVAWAAFLWLAGHLIFATFDALERFFGGKWDH